MRMLAGTLLLIAVLAPPAGLSRTAGDEIDPQLYDRARAASVEILGDDRQRGSGWFVDNDGLVVTAAHVAGPPGQRLEVLVGPKLDRVQARLVAIDRGHDLALVRVTPRAGGYPALPLAAGPRRPGQQVWLLGSPIFRHAVMVPGRMARRDLTYEYLIDRSAYVHCFHVAAAAPRGVSGGPWLDSAGNVVGVQSGAMSIGPVIQGIAFVAPAAAVRALVASGKSASTPTLGVAIEETWQQPRRYLQQLPPRTDGLVVRRLTEKGAAMQAGIKVGELILKFNEQPVRLPDELLDAVRRSSAAQLVTVEVLDPSTRKRRSLQLPLGKLENH